MRCQRCPSPVVEGSVELFVGADVATANLCGTCATALVAWLHVPMSPSELLLEALDSSEFDDVDDVDVDEDADFERRREERVS